MHGGLIMERNPQVDQYIEDLAPDRKAALEQIRTLIRTTLPDIKETMQYRMPTFELDEVVCAAASQKQYISLYMDVELVEEHRDELAHLDVGKSCIRFKKIEDLPLNTIQKILEETVAKQKAS
jgi:uncharacterized protein YdhG (YjbR/CyaY superfamily)